MFRRFALIIVLALFAGVLAYSVTRRLLPAAPTVPDAEAKLAWLAREFELNPDQAAEIDLLQVAYQPVCSAHCAAIFDAQARLAAATTPSEKADAMADLEQLKRICADATRDHLQTVAAVMVPAQATRFLALMESRVAHAPGQAGAPSLDAAP